uniref:Uncharacterized protein n=1 Tax=Meloidogyne enterolobii TaxID=390850 RepID=A0A6V7UTT8_MELEN|nr:unnamed protein product [Meloidogyne enterolobii]
MFRNIYIFVIISQGVSVIRKFEVSHDFIGKTTIYTKNCNKIFILKDFYLLYFLELS